MRATTPILMCDHEDGCDETTPDFYEMLAQNWRELMDKGWTYDPYRDPDAALCPKHAPEPQGENA
ncbi:hypothetical protein [Cryobacterium cryoconiti]|uniref:Uncharacterized protein n=1 Tax=Cryobacterium cryoconiti TaxID=1259239 RepID=A0A4Y8JTZ9_9MICO|nr:hypothetical protein [Cryobacterium cryoconiti]TFD27467.1 hypothetical protein E3T49_13060 [Cryobacterium cryoconiti]